LAKKTKKNKQPQPTPKSNTKWLSLATFILVGILIFYPPYFRGLFFKEDMFLYHLITALVFIVVWVKKIKTKDYTIIRTPLDWAVLAYAGAYLLSLIGAVHPGEAFFGFLKALNYFMVYWMVTQVVKDYKYYVAILNMLLAAGTGVALIGLLTATGYCHYPAAVVNGVIQSTLQYSNATAAYLAVISIIGAVLWIRRQSLPLKITYGIATYLTALVVLAAVSKGAWLIWIIGIIILLIGMPGLYKIKALYSMGLALMAAFVTSEKLIPAISGPNIKAGLPILFIGIIIVLAGQALWEALAWLNRKHGKRAVTAAAVVLVIAGTAGAFTFSQHLTGMAPQTLITEGMQIFDSAGNSYSSRLDFYRWGLAIVKDHPVFGTGAGGWNALYHQYQDYSVFTTEVHNHFLQIWVEAGTLGLIAFLAVWVLFLLAAYRLYRVYKEKETKNDNQDHQILIWGTVAAALACGGHAAFDFDLSIAAVFILLWTLIALINAAWVITDPPQPVRVRPVVNISTATVLTVLMLYCGSSYALANHYAVQGAELRQSVQGKNPAQQTALLIQAANNYQRSVSLNSLDANPYADLGGIYAIFYYSQAQSGQTGQQDYHQKAIEAMERAEKLKPYDTKVRNSLLVNMAMMGEIDKSIEQTEWAIKINPNDINAYEAKGKLLWDATKHYLDQKDYDNAAKYARQAAAVETQINKHRQKVKEDSPLWHGAKLDPTPQLTLNMARAQYLLGQYKQSITKLEPFIKNGTPIPEAYAWYAADLYRLGQQGKARQVINTNPQQTQTYTAIIKQGPLK
jgi:tetratricopeptide (TPR) repeat protein